MNKERIKEKCRRITEFLESGHSPKELSNDPAFGVSHEWESVISEEEVELNVDFEEGFGICFWYDSTIDSEWHWSNSGEIWIEEDCAWVYWTDL